MNILKDLLYYDDNLHKTHNDLSSFTNTNSIKTKSKQGDMFHDPNKDINKNI
jgi:hypothetical protein